MLPRYNFESRMSRKHAGLYLLQVRVEAAVVMSATLEYLVAEVLELAGNCSKYVQPLKSILLSSMMCLSRYMKKRRIIPHHIQVVNCLIHSFL